MSLRYRSNKWIAQRQIVGFFTPAARRLGPEDAQERGRKRLLVGDFRHQSGAFLLTAGNRWLETAYSCATLLSRFSEPALESLDGLIKSRSGSTGKPSTPES